MARELKGRNTNLQYTSMWYTASWCPGTILSTTGFSEILDTYMYVVLISAPPPSRIAYAMQYRQAGILLTLL